MRIRQIFIPLLLALIALPARAATPEQKDLGPGQSVSWTGATMTAANHEAQCDGQTNPCDPFKIDVNVPNNFWDHHDGGLMVSIDGFKAPNDFDLYVQPEFGQSDFFGGSQVYSSTQPAGLPEAVFVPDPVGRVTVTVIPYETVNASYHGFARLAIWPKSPPSPRSKAPIAPNVVNPFGSAPSVAIDPSSPARLVAAYLSASPDEVSVSVSRDGGRTWRSRGTLPGYGETSTGYATALSVSLVYEGSNVYAIVHQNAQDGDRAMLHRSTDGGNTWSDPVQVAWVPQPGATQSPQLPTGDYLFVDSKVEPIDMGAPKLAISGSTMIACWGETIYPDVGYVYAEALIAAIGTPATGLGPTHLIVAARSTDGGATWTPPQIVSGLPRLNSRLPAGDDADTCDATTDRSGGFHVAWYDQTSSSIRLANEAAGAPLFSTPITIANVSQPRAMNGVGLSPVTTPSLASSKDGSIAVAWEDPGSVQNDVMFSRSHDNGSTWSNAVRVNDPSRRAADHVLPAMSAGSDGSYDIAFFDRHNDPSNYYFDAYFARTLDGIHWVNTRMSRRMFSGMGFGNHLCLGGCPFDPFGAMSFALDAPAIATAADGSSVVLWRDPSAPDQTPHVPCFRGKGCFFASAETGLVSTRIPFYQQFGGRTRHVFLR
ncbi:MAG: sialidase family protein [Actinomycetota bacterium]